MIRIKPSDLSIEFWDSKTNTTSNFGHHLPSGIKITHIPTEIVVTEDSAKSQYENKDLALMKIAILIKKAYEGE